MVFRLKAQASWRSIVHRIAQPRSKTSAGDFLDGSPDGLYLKRGTDILFSVNGESRGAGCSAARRSHLNLPGNGSRGDRGRDLRIGVHCEDSDFHTTEGHFGSSGEAVSRDRHRRPDRTAGWAEAASSGCNAKFLVAVYLTLGEEDCHDSSERCVWNNRGHVGVRKDRGTGGNIRCEPDACGLGEALTQDVYRLANDRSRGPQSNERPET